MKIEFVELTKEEFDNKMAEYNSNLDRLFVKGRFLETQLKERFGNLYYEES